ncbi:hypothetical protein TOPH_07378 [Tolypocladium ophioglossoides CBS 100239]|uniref:Uncharacterized protein n=1 Tax=Tolypocladium ophioglossoides (strain CBS 100239) TaxID=1163406 RepID=A0A0L0N1F4_TOLOC|nr:hypothetical protein TOPH_07378 [Tolypocladium ophioglossoides CBS 100239]
MQMQMQMQMQMARRPGPGALHSCPIDYRLGAGRVDPFRSSPGPWRPYVPALTDHYIVHMAQDIAELDGPGHAGLLRTRWYPLVLSHAATFAVVLLLAAANHITNLTPLSFAGGRDGLLGFASLDAYRQHLAHLKHASIAAIDAALSDPRRRLSDAAIGAVAKMASFEAMHGDVASYRMHMRGLRLMLDLRGGLGALGLGGLLRRIVVWIDLNASFLLGVERYFPGQTFTGEDEVAEPNPARFIAIR